jgi:putative hemolysin
MKIKKIIFTSIILVVVALFISGCSSPQNDTSQPSNNESSENNSSLLNKAKEVCEKNDGYWIDSANECEGISQQMCEENGGEFNECGSACRNDPDAEMCTMQCVTFCDFSELASNTTQLSQNENDESINNSIIVDSYGNEVPNSCQTWFDGCNTCQVSEDGMACTRMMCSEDSIEPAECRNFKNTSESSSNTNEDSMNNNEVTQITDNSGNVIPNSCQTWFDGCNTCQVSEDGELTCTEMACGPDAMEPAECREYR